MIIMFLLERKTFKLLLFLSYSKSPTFSGTVEKSISSVMNLRIHKLSSNASILAHDWV